MNLTSGFKAYRKYLVFATTSMALLMASIDSTIVATALSSIQNGLKAPLNWTGWVITIYQLTMMTMMPLVGRISDEWGRKRVFMASIIIFTFSSLMCALSTNVYILIFFRFLQALGGGSFMPSAVGIVGEHFKEHRAQAVGLFTSVFPIGGIVGPALGGFLLDAYSWQAIFLVNLPIGVLLIISTCLLLDKDPKFSRTEVDFAGAGLFAAMIMCLMYFLTRLGESPEVAAQPANYLLLVMSAVFLLLFIRREKKAKIPVLDFTLLHSRPFAVVNILNIIHGATIFGIAAFIPYYAKSTYGMSDLASGTLLTIRALGMIATATVASMLLERTGYRLPMRIGFFLILISTFTLNPYFHVPAIMGVTIPVYWWLALLVFVFGVGIGLVSPSSNNAAIELMPEKISAISGLRGMFRHTGSVMGTSLIVLILSRYPDQAAGFRVVFLASSIMLIIAQLLIRWVPDVPRQRLKQSFQVSEKSLEQ